MLPSEILTRAADLIEPEGRWTQGYWARNSDGFPVNEYSETATCWCARGALLRASGGVNSFRAAKFLEAVIDDEGAIISSWSDAPARIQSEVVSALRAAAELAKQQETA